MDPFGTFVIEVFEAHPMSRESGSNIIHEGGEQCPGPVSFRLCINRLPEDGSIIYEKIDFLIPGYKGINKLLSFLRMAKVE